jgi:hypothetical protein
VFLHKKVNSLETLPYNSIINQNFIFLLIAMANSNVKKIIIRIIVILFLVSSGLTFVLYLMAPSPAPQQENQTVNIEEYIDVDTTDVVIPSEEIDVDNPENNDIQVVVTENEDQNEMNQTVEVPLEDGTTDTPTLGDFSESLQLSQ